MNEHKFDLIPSPDAGFQKMKADLEKALIDFEFFDMTSQFEK
jgi:hypothetical protein